MIETNWETHGREKKHKKTTEIMSFTWEKFMEFHLDI